MRRIAVLSLFLCLVAVCRAQYIGSQYVDVKLGYIVDESQVQVYIHVIRCASVIPLPS